MNGLFGGKGSIVPMGLWFYLFPPAMNRWAIVMYALGAPGVIKLGLMTLLGEGGDLLKKAAAEDLPE